MDKKQMEMLSVKNAIERMVQNYIDAFKKVGSHKEFFDAVERLVASFYVGHQIDNNYLVRSVNHGDLEIRFSTKGHGTRITFMLPEQLRWRVDTRKPQVEEAADEQIGEAGQVLVWKGGEANWSYTPTPGMIEYNTEDTTVRIFDGEKWVEVSSDVLRKMGADPKDMILEGSIRIGRNGGLELYQNGKWVQLPQSIGSGISTTPAPTTAPEPTPVVEKEFDPFEAYERAKKAVKNMV